MAYDSDELSQVWRVGVEARRQVKDGEVDEGEKRGRHEAWKSVSFFFLITYRPYGIAGMPFIQLHCDE